MYTSDSPADYNRIMDQAKQRAQELRREAMDDFWRGADAVLAATVAGACRSAQRLADRLTRHARTRSGPNAQPCTHRDGV